MGKRKKDKRTNNDLRYYTDPATLTPLKTVGEIRCSQRVSNSCPTRNTRRVIVK